MKWRKKLEKTIKIVKKEKNNLATVLQNLKETDVVFKEIQKDTIGSSSSNPTWGYVYDNEDGNLTYKGIGLYKEYDYDFPNAACSEKIWSILGKNILRNVRIPEIDVVQENPREQGIISYRVLDNDAEDLIHITDVLFNKFERDDLKKQRDIFHLKDILECIQIQVQDHQNYKQIEKAVIQTILLDSITNNRDRHANNWALIRNKKTNHYDLAVYDHSIAFIDMLEERAHLTVNGWVSSYIITDEGPKKREIGEKGDNLVKYIFDNYKEYFDEFYTKFDENLDNAIEEISNSGLKMNMTRLRKRLYEKRSFLRKLYKEKGEMEHEL